MAEANACLGFNRDFREHAQGRADDLTDMEVFWLLATAGWKKIDRALNMLEAVERPVIRELAASGNMDAFKATVKAERERRGRELAARKDAEFYEQVKTALLDMGVEAKSITRERISQLARAHSYKKDAVINEFWRL